MPFFFVLVPLTVLIKDFGSESKFSGPKVIHITHRSVLYWIKFGIRMWIMIQIKFALIYSGKAIVLL